MGTPAQWAAEGISRGMLRGMVRRGELVRQRYGTYATATVVADAAGDKALRHALDVRSFLAACSAGAVASHESAALVHGLPLLHEPAAGSVHVTRPPGAFQGRAVAGVRYHAAQLPKEHVTTHHETPVTTVSRTVVDLARTRPFADAVVVADAAIRRMTGKTVISSTLAAAKRVPGVERARRVLDFSDGRAGSPLESCARVLFAERGLPKPDLQRMIAVIDGRDYHEYKVDFCWEDRKTVAETDGLTKYNTREDVVKELKRDRLLRERGYKVVHITWKELLEDPERIIRRILRAFQAYSPYGVLQLLSDSTYQMVHITASRGRF